MHTLECFEFTLGRLSQLRERLMQPDVVYDHEYYCQCGTPSCALGWATTVWPGEICLVGNYVQQCSDPFVTNYLAGQALLGCGYGTSAYLFATEWGVYRNPFDPFDRRNIRTDMSLPETIRRFDKLIAYYQRRVDTLHREQRERLELRRSRRTTRKRAVEVAV